MLLPTANVKVISKGGKEIIARAMLDTGSQLCLITTELAMKLGQPILPSSKNIVGIFNIEQTVDKSINVDIYSCTYPYMISKNCLVVDNITSLLPQQTFEKTGIQLPDDLNLADISFHVTNKIDILLSADVFFQSLLPQPKELLEGDAAQPRALHTQFGYVVGGNLPNFTPKKPVGLLCQECNSDINETLSGFWQAESVPEVFVEHTSEQKYCERYFVETIQLTDNKFIVSMPLKVPIYDVNNVLGDSLSLAMKRFLNIEKRLQNDHQLFKEYQQFIHEYIALGHATYIDISQYDLSKDAVYFLAHHPVIRTEAISTKLRVVMDGSMRTSNKISLNDILLNGPIVQPELFDTLLSFRLHKYFFVCDIRRMFRNILLNPEQRSLQNILWRDSVDEPIKCLQLNTVTYGLKNSPYLATRCLNELADRFQEQFPGAASVLLGSTYVDDILYTDDSKSNLIETKEQLKQLLSKGSFELHKWSSNDNDILKDIPIEQQVSGEKELQKDRSIKTLGIKFNIDTDSFIMSCPIPEKVPKTKREILSFISQFYDPLGIAGPVFVQAKVIIQKLWQANVGWDSIPPHPLEKEWVQFYNDLISMPPINVKRNVCIDNQQKTQLIGFSDASIKAYGCSIFLRATDNKGNVSMSLLCSKSRIAPKDSKLSVPRLELNAALLMSKLINRVYETLSKKVHIESVHLFSDSQVVLAWLKTEPVKLNAYVANRINLINQYTLNHQWSYINTDQNPSDCLSRGVNPSELQNNELWWSGPQCMLSTDYNFSDFSFDTLSVEELPEVKLSNKNYGKVVCAASQGNMVSLPSSILDKYSDINKAIRVLAYIIRFTKNARPGSQKTKENFVTFSERSHALQLLIKNEQSIYFKQDIASLKTDKPASSQLKGLNPFLDADGIMRVGGRLQHSALPYSQKHQIILPSESKLVRLLIENEHLKLLHAGQKHVLSSLNLTYWIINGLRTVKKYIHKCIMCFRLKGVTAKQLMGSLPADRVHASRPFEKVGIDFAGPIMIKQSRIRSVITTKGYIAVYVCFATKAIHVELVSDLTTDAFLASFKRFISRRNCPTDVYCDNASTFKSAKTKLTELYKLHNSQQHRSQVQNQTAALGINFHFIPSYSPVFAGLWEAAVKSVKHHLKRVLGSQVFTYEQLYTVLVQIEGILNSRPITPMSSDVEDLSYLTPGHFLTGAPFTCIPDQNLMNMPENKIKFWNKCTVLQQRFWSYWSKQYLNVLQNRPKWKDNLPNVKVGSLVILRELDTAPMVWPMARVTKVFPGNDGKVRALEVKKANGKTHTTSITKICLLPIDS